MAKKNSSGKNGKFLKTASEPVWDFDGATFTPGTVEWPVLKNHFDDCEEEQALKRLGWNAVKFFFFGKNDHTDTVTVLGKLKPDIQEAIGDEPGAPHEYEAFLVRFFPLNEGWYATIRVGSFPLLMDLLNRWAHLWAMERLDEQFRSHLHMMEKAFIAAHGHRIEDSCRSCAPLTKPEDDVMLNAIKDGQAVRLRRPLSTNGGTHFKPGEKLIASDYFSGSFTLSDPKNPKRTIYNVLLKDVIVEVDHAESVGEAAAL